MAPVYNRSRLWVDPPFQARLLLRMGLSLAVFTLVVWHISFVLDVLREFATKPTALRFGDLYVDYFWKQLPLFFTFLLLGPTLLYNLLKFSHRVAGPLFRCRKVMEEMAAGKVVREFHPRKNDLMGDLFASFNNLIRTCNTRVAETNGHSSSQDEVANAAPSGTHSATQ